MFDKLKQLKKLKDLQDSLKKKEIAVEKEGISVVIDGSLKVKEIRINSEIDKSKQENLLRECFNEAMQKAQIEAAKEMSSLGGFGI